MKKASFLIFSILTFLIMLTALFFVFIYAPTEKTMGVVQKIFYFHVPSGWIAFLAFFIVFLSGVKYLMKKDKYWDIVGSSSAEVGVIFCSLVLITGPIWAKKVWGIFWTWDAKLTSAVVLWLIYISYILLRKYVIGESKRANISAVVGILGFIDVPLVYMSTRWWRTQHPQPVIGGGENSGLEPKMLLTFFICLIAFTLLFFFILYLKLSIENARKEIDYLYKSVEGKET
jgi:heme exporter protein C